jgi:hypothetical protein
MSEEIRDAVRAVLEEAARWRAFTASTAGPRLTEEETRLVLAVDALAELTPPWSEDHEGPMPWRKVIAGDEALGADGKYHRVLAVFSTGTPDPSRGPMDSGNAVVVEIEIQGKPRRYRKSGSVETTIRRRLSPEASALAALERAGLDLSTVISERA